MMFICKRKLVIVMLMSVQKKLLMVLMDHIVSNLFHQTLTIAEVIIKLEFSGVVAMLVQIIVS